jgi:hypothetical protein
MKHLARLRAAGAPAAAALDPVALYIDAQERHVSTLLDAAARQYEMQAGAARRQHHHHSRGGDADDCSAAGRAAPAGAAAAAELAAVQYVAAITAALVVWAPQFWELTQGRAPELLAAGAPAAALDAGMAAAERCMASLLQRFVEAVRGALVVDPGRPGGVGHQGALQSAIDLGMARLDVQRQGAPPEVQQRLQALVALAGRVGVQQLRAHLSSAAGALCSRHGQPGRGQQGSQGQSSSAAVASLRQLAVDGLRYVNALQAECARADVDPLSGPPACPPHELLCLPFTAYAQTATAAARADGRGADGRLLTLSSTLVAARSEALQQLAAAWAPLLSSGCTAPQIEAALGDCAAAIERAEDELMGAYIERKQAALDGIMEEFFFGASSSEGAAAALNRTPSSASPLGAACSEWELAPPPRGVRPVALDVLAALAAAQAELAAGAPALVRDAMCELFSGLVAGVAEVVHEGLPGGAGPGGVCQLWVEVAVLEAAAAGLVAGDESLASAFADLNAVMERQLGAVMEAASGEEMLRLAAWCGEDEAGVSVSACRRRMEQLRDAEEAAARGLVHPLRLLAAAQVNG